MKRAVAAAAAACALVAAFLVSGAVASHGGPGVKTTKAPFLVGTAPGVVVDPILSVGEVVPNGQNPPYQMSGIPDGLGAYPNKSNRWDWLRGDRKRTFTVVMNHELGRTFPNNPPGVDSRISRLEIDRETRSVHRAEYLFTGLEGYERFCSATLRIVGGRPFYFTGEEAVKILPNQPPGPVHDGSSIVMDPETGMWRDTKHFGHLQHENVIPLRLKKWVFLTLDDDFRNVNNPPPGPPGSGIPGWPRREDAYLYAYISPSFNGALRGTDGGLHVFVPNAGEEKSNAEVTRKDQEVRGHWEFIPQSENTSAEQLKQASAARGAFKFDRLEDAAPIPGHESRVYIADTGKPPVSARGRVYQFDFNKHDPAGTATMRMVLNGDGTPPHGGDDIFNPDNMDASERVLLIQEDRESAFRAGTPANSGGFARVMEYRLSDGRLRSVARVNTTPGTPDHPMTENCAGCLPGTWESSGIIDARHVLGKDWWILDVQAHNSTAPQPGPTLVPGSSSGENGQLLAVKIPGSHGGGDHHDDDDDDDD